MNMIKKGLMLGLLVNFTGIQADADWTKIAASGAVAGVVTAAGLFAYQCYKDKKEDAVVDRSKDLKDITLEEKVISKEVADEKKKKDATTKLIRWHDDMMSDIQKFEVDYHL